MASKTYAQDEGEVLVKIMRSFSLFLNLKIKDPSLPLHCHSALQNIVKHIEYGDRKHIGTESRQFLEDFVNSLLKGPVAPNGSLQDRLEKLEQQIDDKQVISDMHVLKNFGNACAHEPNDPPLMETCNAVWLLVKILEAADRLVYKKNPGSGGLKPENKTPKSNHQKAPSPAPEQQTQICKFWAANGSCHYGETCKFSHGNPKPVDHFAPPKKQNDFGLGGLKPENKTPKINHPKAFSPAPEQHTQICKFWAANGSCHYGETCKFSHGNPKPIDHFAPPKKNYPKAPSPAPGLAKTQICKFWTEHGSCKFGENCKFSHENPAPKPFLPKQVCWWPEGCNEPASSMFDDFCYKHYQQAPATRKCVVPLCLNQAEKKYRYRCALHPLA